MKLEVIILMALFFPLVFSLSISLGDLELTSPNTSIVAQIPTYDDVGKMIDEKISEVIKNINDLKNETSSKINSTTAYLIERLRDTERKVLMLEDLVNDIKNLLSFPKEAELKIGNKTLECNITLLTNKFVLECPADVRNDTEKPNTHIQKVTEQLKKHEFNETNREENVSKQHIIGSIFSAIRELFLKFIRR
jgi:primosomal protein N''